MTVLRAPTAFLVKVQLGAIRRGDIFIYTEQAPVGRAGKVEETSPPSFFDLDTTARIFTLPAGITGTGGRAAQVTFSVEIDGRFIRLNRECACDAGPALAPVLLALGFTPYAPVGASLAYLVPDAA